jgi:transcriptional regulator with XRE-family HTH domain
MLSSAKYKTFPLPYVTSGKHFVMPTIREGLAAYVQRVMREKNLSFRDVAAGSLGRISHTTVNDIANGNRANVHSETLVALAKGLGVLENEVFRVARGLPVESPDQRLEILAEAFDARELSPADWVEIEAVLKTLIEQKKRVKS